MRIGLLFLLALMGVPLAGCGDEDEPGRTVSVGDPMGGRDGSTDGGRGGSSGDGAGGRGASGGSGGTGGGGGTDDGGLDASDGLDGGIMGAIWCDDVEPAPLDTGEPDPNAEIRNGLVVPRDFVVTRAEAVWQAGCGLPVLRITLSDGGCPVGEGHELTFFVPAGDDGSSVVIGQNVIMEEPAPNNIRVRYTRPSRFSDDGTWGTCADATGTLDVLGELDFEIDSRLQATFTLELTRCDGGMPETAQMVNGTFNVEIPDSLDTVCP